MDKQVKVTLKKENGHKLVFVCHESVGNVFLEDGNSVIQYYNSITDVDFSVDMKEIREVKVEPYGDQ